MLCVFPIQLGQRPQRHRQITHCIVDQGKKVVGISTDPCLQHFFCGIHRNLILPGLEQTHEVYQPMQSHRIVPCRFDQIQTLRSIISNIAFRITADQSEVNIMCLRNVAGEHINTPAFVHEACFVNLLCEMTLVLFHQLHALVIVAGSYVAFAELDQCMDISVLRKGILQAVNTALYGNYQKDQDHFSPNKALKYSLM